MPADDAEAWALREELLEEAERDAGLADLGIEMAPPSDEMKELHRKLTARFPCICDDSEADSPWADGPLINAFGERVAVLTIRPSGVERALPFIVATATGPLRRKGRMTPAQRRYWVISGLFNAISSCVPCTQH